MLDLNFTPFPEITSNRLSLQRIEQADAADILYLRGSEKVMKYIDKPLCKNIGEAIAHIKKMDDGIQGNTSIFWGIRLKDGPKLLGVISYHSIDTINYRAEIGYILHDEYWRKGIISEAVKEVINFGFQKMRLHSIEAKINPDNMASRNLLQKHLFQKEAYFRENYFFNGNFLDTEIYSLLKKSV